MAFPLAGFGKIHKILYSDTMTVYRRQEVLNPDGTTDIDIEQTAIYVDVPCRLSFTRSYDRADGKQVDANYIDVQPTIHCSPDIITRSGDYCVLNRCDDKGSTMKIFKGNLGDSRWYSDHQEIVLSVEEES